MTTEMFFLPFLSSTLGNNFQDFLFVHSGKKKLGVSSGENHFL